MKKKTRNTIIAIVGIAIVGIGIAFAYSTMQAIEETEEALSGTGETSDFEKIAYTILSEAQDSPEVVKAQDVGLSSGKYSKSDFLGAPEYTTLTFKSSVDFCSTSNNGKTLKVNDNKKSTIYAQCSHNNKEDILYNCCLGIGTDNFPDKCK